MTNPNKARLARMLMDKNKRKGEWGEYDQRDGMRTDHDRQQYRYNMDFMPDVAGYPMGYGHEYSARHLPEHYRDMTYGERGEMDGEREMGHERQYRIYGGGSRTGSRMGGRTASGRFRGGRGRQSARHIEPELMEYDEYEEDDEEDVRRQPIRAGGTFWMDAPHKAEKLTRAKAEEWVSEMENEDPAKPEGGKWTMEQVKPIAQKLGIQPDTQKFIDFYAMMNAMYSDYYEVAKKFNVATPDFFAEMAKAFVCDKDAVKNKTALYYEYIVQH